MSRMVSQLLTLHISLDCDRLDHGGLGIVTSCLFVMISGITPVDTMQLYIAILPGVMKRVSIGLG